MDKKLKRKCIATQEVIDIDKLIRIVKLPNGKFEVNSYSKGRGAYIKKDLSLFEKIQNQKLLNRAFKTNVTIDVYKKVKKEMEIINER